MCLLDNLADSADCGGLPTSTLPGNGQKVCGGGCLIKLNNICMSILYFDRIKIQDLSHNIFSKCSQ